ncbi:DUF6885 family protein [Streptosporangium saharense]|uniref:DUF6885 family protein n=1 Tax=Streptosporangium saharense TaxID=1706840 RepID=UPI0034233074
MAVLTMDVLEGVRRFAGATALLGRHRRALPQPDQLCGPFWAWLAVAALTGEDPPDLSAFAVAAGTAVWPHDLPSARPVAEPSRTDAWTGVSRAADVESAGTSAPGVGAAVERLSSGAVAAVPATGAWTADRLLALLDALHDRGRPAVPVANLSTGLLWGSRPTRDQIDHYLQTGDFTLGPSADWRVGHFTALCGTLPGDRGTLVAVADTYPGLGDQGLHLQPVESLATALARSHPRTGGVLLAVPADDREAVRDLVLEAHLEPTWWDNGTPFQGG